MKEDIKKYQKAQKLKKWREKVQPLPWYYDGLENLCERLHPEKIILQVTDIKDLSWDTKIYRFVSAKPDKPLPPFLAGQYIGLIVEINGVRTSRPYSIVSSPNQLAYYELAIKKKDDGFVSPYIYENIKLGDIFDATEPLGELYHNPLFHGNDLVFIAGGVGITPFMSILRDITEKVLQLNVWLIFGCLKERDILFKEELEDIQSRRPNIKIKYILSEPESEWAGTCGFITEEEILNHIGSYKNKFFYIVGSREMYLFIERELKKIGIPNHSILFESYGVPEDITKVPGWPNEIDRSKKIKITLEVLNQGRKQKEEIEALCVEPVLNSLERVKQLGFEINSGCRSGQCALCRTKLVSGKVFLPSEVIIREVDKDFGYIHPCISYPITDIHLDLTLT